MTFVDLRSGRNLVLVSLFKLLAILLVADARSRHQEILK